MKKAIVITLFIAVLLGGVTSIAVTTVLGGGISNAMEEDNDKPIQAILSSVNIKENDNDSKLESILYDEELYVPLSEVVDVDGNKVIWDEETKTAKIVKKEKRDIYNKDNPAPIGVNQDINLVEGTNEYISDITISEVNRGEQAWKLIRETNRHNKQPQEDEEYILAKIKIEILESVEDRKIDVSRYPFELFSSDNIKYDDFVTIEPFPRIKTQLKKGEKHEGYIAFMVKKDDMSPKVVYEINSNDNIWFSLGQ